MFASQASSSSACNSIPIRATATFGAIHRLLAALVPMLLAPTASALTVSPNPLVLSVRAGESATFPVQLANPAASAVDWTLKFVDANGSANTLEAAMARLSASGTSLNGSLPNRVDFAGGKPAPPSPPESLPADSKSSPQETN